jgi:hypothetical protein
MNMIKKLLAGSIAIAAFSCNDGIDPITPVAPGEDLAPPAISITYPLEGTLVRVKEDVAPITIQFEATDDIEIQKIDVILDGQTVNTYSSFLDYRRAVLSYTYATLANGPHVLEIKTTDLSNKTTSKSVDFEKVEPYKPLYDGEVFYMPFDGDYLELVSITEPTVVGGPSFSDVAKAGKSYKGATDAYLSADATDLMGDEFSAAFWYKIDGVPDRSGILTISPPDPTATLPNKRTSGFRLFREGSATKQTFKLNVGTGGDESWFDGTDAASINPVTTTGWIHLAITISQTKAAVYINGNLVSSGTFGGVDWTDCSKLSIASGAPNFIEWGHLSDNSLYDELRIFNKALTQAEVQALMQ